MRLARRGFLRWLAVLTAGIAVGWRPSARARTSTGLVLRQVASADSESLRTIMTSSVCDTDAFFGKCGEWSLGWAIDLTGRCPNTVVLTSGATPIAFMEVPPIRAELPSPDVGASAMEIERHSLRQRNRTTFRVSAAGVRDDILSRDESVLVFKKVLYYGFVAARRLGYTHVEAISPWAQHPRMLRKFTDYRGCELVEPVSRARDGAELYWLRWSLDDAIDELAREGAGKDRLDGRA